MAAVLEVDQLVKRYPKHEALSGVSLRIEAGEIFGLLGPNGAGKTTLIGAVCGLVKKTSGSIRLFGQDIEQGGATARAAVGLVPQEINFDPFFTVREALELQLGYYGRSPDAKRVAEVLEALSLDDKADQPMRALSGGMKRRLLIAKALVHRPKLVFLDEPTAGVDVELRRDLWAYVRQLKAEGTTVVLTTHYLEEAEALADRVGVLARGKLLVVEEKSSLMRRMGERRLEVQFAEPVTRPLPDGTLSNDGKTFTFVERPGGVAAGEMLGRLYALQVPVADVSVKPASLEEVLLRVLNQGEAL